MPDERRTFTEWEKIYGITLFNVDRQDFATYDNAPLMLTGFEFEQRVAGALARRRPHWVAAEAAEFAHEGMYADQPPRTSAVATNVESGIAEPTQPSRTPSLAPKVRTAMRKRRVSLRTFEWLLVLATLPTVATWLVGLLVRTISRFVRIHWLASALVLLFDLILLIIQPVAALIAGPGYLWYKLFNFIYQIAMHGVGVGKHVVLHKSLNLIGANQALFSNMTVGGSPLSLYFGFSQAIVSSIFWATLIVFVQALVHELRNLPPRAVGLNDGEDEENGAE